MKRSFLLFFIPFLVFAAAVYIVSQVGCDSILKPNPIKKMPFSHQTHIEHYGAKCNACHGFHENGRFKGIPTLKECRVCHTKKNDPRFAKYKDSDKPWGAYAKQPDLVYFSHMVVMASKNKNGKTKLKCISCHGDKESSKNTEMIQGKMLMGKCMKCHESMKVSNKCLVCHD